MPPVSKAQAQLMKAAAHSPTFAQKVGIKPSIAKKYMSDQNNRQMGTPYKSTKLTKGKS